MQTLHVEQRCVPSPTNIKRRVRVGKNVARRIGRRRFHLSRHHFYRVGQILCFVPIRSGVGARLGINVGYLKFTREPTWNPF